MKKIFGIFIAFSVLFLISCKEKTSQKISEETPISENKSEIKVVSSDKTSQKKATKPTKIDFDFTKMNYNMASGVLFDMLVESTKYENKTVKITGEFVSEMHDENRLYAVLIWDATGCCPTGIGFIPPENMKFPEDFPKLNSEITITGTMKKAKVGENESLYLFVEDLRSER